MSLLCHGLGWRLPLDFAVYASADRHRYRLAGLTKPGRDDRAEASGWAAGGDNQQVVGVWQGGVFALTFAAHDRAFPTVGPLRPLDAGMLEYVLANVGLGPAGGLEMIA